VNRGGDFSADAAAVGEVTARLHQALAGAFGVEAADPGRWAAELEAELASTSHPHLQAPAATRLVHSLRTIEDPGPAMRIHGDYHLGQVMRTPDGWFVLDFEGEPARPVEERLRPSSPLRDVAGMLRSFQYASMVAAVPGDGDDHGAALSATGGREWEVRAREAFLGAYLDAADHALLPAAASDRITLLNAFELQKAAYEVRYEQAHRPQWGYIPLEAISRLVPAG
jgi:maltokinase